MHSGLTDPAIPGSDADLYASLAAHHFAGADQEAFEAALVAYAQPVFLNWLRSGQIYVLCAKAGRPVRPSLTEAGELDRDPAEYEALALETIATAIVFFRERGLRDGGWRADGGASLTSYFVHACILRFPVVFRQWSRARRAPPTTGYGIDVAAAGLDRPSAHWRSEDPAELAVSKITSAQELEKMPPEIRAVAQGIVDGKTFAQIGKELGMTARAVEGALYRYRKTRSGKVAR